MKKRSFLLIEVLIAFSLVTICSIPLVRQPLKLYKEQISHLETLEKERLAEWSFSEIKEMFLKNEILWSDLPSKGEVSDPFQMADLSINILGQASKAVKRSFTLKGKGEKVGRGETVYKQLEVHLKLDEEPYCLRLPVQKVSI